MASWPKREDANLMLEADKPHFFKIILEDSIRGGKLCIPKKFAMKYGDKLPSSIFLNVPSGKKWRVDLIRRDDEIWFKNGWQEFAEYYSLAHGSFLVFQYDKKSSHFNVIIFDMTASEIDYPYDVSNGDTESNGLERPKNEEETESDVSTVAPKEISSIYPFFKMVISSIHLQRSYAHVPLNFLRNIQQNRVTAKLQVGNRWWDVKLHIHKRTDSRRISKRGQFSAGWRQFARESSLKVGDVCVFELIDNEVMVMKVSIFRHVK